MPCQPPTTNNSEISSFKLRNKNGVTIEISNLGCRIISIVVPDRLGRFKDILLGYNDLIDYLTDENYFGAVVGRFANIIQNGRFQLNNKVYYLYQNFNKHTLHGGEIGYDRAIWEVKEYNGSVLKFHYLSKDKEENFPGNLNIWVEYRLTEDNCLELKFTARSDQDTIINITTHPYINLGGHDAGNIEGHELWMDADQFAPVSDEFTPLGGYLLVEDSPFDFRELKNIGDAINTEHEQLVAVGGYDHSFRLNKSDEELKKAAIIIHRKSGRKMEISTTEPSLHLYTANSLEVNEDMGKGNTSYGRRSAFCLEPQHFPDSPNQVEFPSTILRANDLWSSKSVFRFDIIDN